MEHLDVIIVGAGISGISAAVHWVRPVERSVGIFERRVYWYLHLLVSGHSLDSDMHTLGFSFKPWMAESPLPTACDHALPG